MFSCVASKGVSSHLLKAGSKRRRTKQQIEDEKAAEMLEEQRSKAKLMEYNTLQAQVKAMESEKSHGDAAIDLLKQFVATGFVVQDEEGKFVVPGISGERKFKPFEDPEDKIGQ